MRKTIDYLNLDFFAIFLTKMRFQPATR